VRHPEFALRVPVINALSTLLLLVTFLAVWGAQRLSADGNTGKPSR
jgi:ABC-type spermidine/putrescine transport system permease subunit II